MNIKFEDIQYYVYPFFIGEFDKTLSVCFKVDSSKICK